jgi:hypothetical protein
VLLERTLVLLYLAGCIGIGVYASRRVLGSRDEYRVAGRRIGTGVNALAIMASLASGGSIIGIMGLAYAQGIPATLALFAGAVVGFPLASILVAGQLRRFGKYTITDFLTFRYPNAVTRYLVPALIVVAFTIYIVAQLKAAGIAAEALLGVRYEVALTLAILVFVLYVSVGGMLAITWTDVVLGALAAGAHHPLLHRRYRPSELESLRADDRRSLVEEGQSHRRCRRPGRRRRDLCADLLRADRPGPGAGRRGARRQRSGDGAGRLPWLERVGGDAGADRSS